MSQDLTFYPVGSYMIMLYGPDHDRVRIEKSNRSLAATVEEAERLLSSSPSSYASYTISHVVKNTLVDKWSPKSHA